jgi:hypothetical protein
MVSRLRLHWRGARFIGFPVQFFVVPYRDIDEIECALGLDALMKLSADEPRLFYDSRLDVLPPLDEFLFFALREKTP